MSLVRPSSFPREPSGWPRSSSRISIRVLALGAAVALLADASAWAAPPAADTSGASVFAQNCSACHQLTGKGVPGAFPALAGDAFLQGPSEPVARLLLNGRGGMPSFRADLDDHQISAVLTYVRSAWGNHAPAISPGVVAKVRGSPAQDHAAQALQAH